MWVVQCVHSTRLGMLLSTPLHAQVGPAGTIPGSGGATSLLLVWSVRQPQLPQSLLCHCHQARCVWCDARAVSQ